MQALSFREIFLPKCSIHFSSLPCVTNVLSCVWFNYTNNMWRRSTNHEVLPCAIFSSVLLHPPSYGALVLDNT
jgi:hypothetical protein